MRQQKVKVLIIEDNPTTREVLRLNLCEANYTTIEVENGEDGLAKVCEEHPQIILLGLGQPDTNGEDFVKKLRQETSVPIIVISAQASESDKVNALDSGADDYVTKPFGVPEMLARVRTALRHAKADSSEIAIFENGLIRVDFATRQVWAKEAKAHLTVTEFQLLSILIRNAGKVMSHRRLLIEVWGESHIEDLHYLRVYMGQIRRKLEPDPRSPRVILTEPGVGYRLGSA